MQLVLRVIGILGTILSVIWFITEPGFSTLSGILASLAAFLGSFVVPKQEKSAETLDQRNRRVMLDHVENFWVKGVLEKSLHGAALLELGIKEDSSKVSYPWAIKKGSTDETLPTGKSMFEIFQEIGLGRSLLVLGAPGSGKTTMLLELARQLIERARQDDTESIPVVFNLASWTEKQTISDWLAAQLNIAYYVPRNTAPKWVSENKMLLLLDGLDEVTQDSRTRCVEAINEFRKEHGLTSLVVCSRIEEYEALKAKLLLEGAITLQPLSSKQINAYFERFGKSLAPVKAVLKKDKALQELAETPLMLSILALAYKDKKADELSAPANLEHQRKHLFDTYITRMFERSTRMAMQAAFSKEETLHYLHWLARVMTRENMMAYQIETMQPEWLETKTQRRLYRLFLGLVIGLSSWLIIGLIFGLIIGPIGGLTVGLVFGLLGGLFGGLIIALFGALRTANEKIIMTDRLSWSWKAAWSGLRFMLISGLIFAVIGGLIGGPIGGLGFGLGFGLAGGLIAALLKGLIKEQIEEAAYPGQRLKQTLFNAVLSSVVFVATLALILGLVGGVTVGLVLGMSDSLGIGLLIGLFVGAMVVLVFGAFREQGVVEALPQHFTLRFVLMRYQLLPWRLIPFLEYAVGLIFLHRVGGSYIFIHRLIMEHFAEMDDEKSSL